MFQLELPSLFTSVLTRPHFKLHPLEIMLAVTNYIICFFKLLPVVWVDFIFSERKQSFGTPFHWNSFSEMQESLLLGQLAAHVFDQLTTVCFQLLVPNITAKSVQHLAAPGRGDYSHSLALSFARAGSHKTCCWATAWY